MARLHIAREPIVFDRLNARIVRIDTPEGYRYIAQVNLNGNWQDVVDYHAVGMLEHTKKDAMIFARRELAAFDLRWR